MDFQSLCQSRFVADESPELSAEGIRQHVRERSQQDARILVGAGQEDGAMQRHNRLPRAGGAGNPCWPCVVPFNQLPLLGMEEHRPPVPRELQGALKFLDIAHHPESALRIGMIERIHHRATG